VGEGGEVFVLDMGEPIKIVDLAREMIRLSGYDPDVDIPIVFSGVRAGEKLFEEILGAEEGTEGTEYEKIFIAKDSRKNDAAELFRKIDLLIEMSSGRDEGRFRIDKINSLFREIVPTYTPNKVE
jgi:FlaA1/EpsC-like NDP-sugar epimerase